MFWSATYIRWAKILIFSQWITSSIILRFVIDLDYIKESIALELKEVTQKSVEQFIEQSLDGMANNLKNILENDKPKTFILQSIEYCLDDIEFVNRFKWGLGNQLERERFLKLTSGKFMTRFKMDANHTQTHDIDDIFQIEPLILQITDNVCHLFEMVDLMQRSITLPDETGIYSDLTRVLYKGILNASVTNLKYAGKTFTSSQCTSVCISLNKYILTINCFDLFKGSKEHWFLEPTSMISLGNGFDRFYNINIHFSRRI
jgi:hypothetical protein